MVEYMDILETVLTFLLISGGLIYLSACLAAFSGHFKTHGVIEDYTPSVSVIIAARNEEKNIGCLLDDLINQDYTPDKLEIVVIDDCSDDNTKGVVKDFIARDKRIRLLETRFSKSQYRYKKRAIHEGILSSNGEIIMTTDADCRVSHGWVKGVVKFFKPEVDLVAGYVTVEGGGFLGCMEALELTGIQAMAAGFMNNGFPITCNGANLAYRRSAFERVEGFEGIGRIVSGDDDLLMQKIAQEKSERVVYIYNKETAVYSEAVDTPGEFLTRRARWSSKIYYYPSASAIALLSVFFVLFIVVILWLLLSFLGFFSYLPIIIGMGMKVSGDMLLTLYGVMKMRRLKLMLVFPIAEILHIPYIIFVTFKGFFGSFYWRGRNATAVSLEYGENVND